MSLSSESITSLKAACQAVKSRPQKFFYCQAGADGKPTLLIGRNIADEVKALKKTAQKKKFVRGTVSREDKRMRFVTETPDANKFQKNLKTVFGKAIPDLKKATIKAPSDGPAPAPPPPAPLRASTEVEASVDTETFDSLTVSEVAPKKDGEEKKGEKKSESSVKRSAKIGLDGNVTLTRARTDAESDDSGSSKVVEKESLKIGAGGVHATTSRSTTVDGANIAESTTRGVSRGDGKIGYGKSSSATVGKVNEDGELIEGTTTKSKVEGGAIVEPDKVGAFGGASGARESVKDGVKTGISGGLSGRFTVSVKEISGSDPARFKIVLSVKLGASVGASVGREGEHERTGAKGSVGVSGSGSAAVTAVYSHEMSAEDAKAYLENLNVSAGGSPANGQHPEFAILAAGGRGAWDVAKGLYEGVAASQLGDIDAMKGLKEGASVEVTREGRVEGGVSLGGELGGVSVGIEVGGQVGSKVRVKQSKKGGYVLFTVEVVDDVGYSGGGKLGYSVASVAVKGEHTESSSQLMTLKLDPNDPKSAAIAGELAAASTQGDITRLIQRYPQLVSERSTSQSASDTDTAEVAVGPLGATMSSSASRSRKETFDEKGERTVEYEGENALGGSVSLGGLKYESNSAEKLTGTVGPDGKAKADLSETNTETDVLKSLLGAEEALDKNPASVVSGGAPLSQTSQTVAGMHLSDEDISALMARAKSPAAWMKGMAPSPRLMKDFLACQAAIKAAGEDKEAALRALSEFVGTKGHDRRELLEARVRGGGSRGGSRYEFPEGLGQLKSDYDELVVGDPLEALYATAGGPAATAKGEELLGRMDRLSASFLTVQERFQDQSAYAEMLAALSRRRAEIRRELRLLAGGQPDETGAKEALDLYNDAITECSSFKDRETALFDEIAGLGASLQDTVKRGEAIKRLRDLYAVWRPRYDEMAGLAQEHGFGADRYWKFKPDTARFERALAGAPGEASEAAPETEDKRKKKAAKPAEPADPLGESAKKLDAVRKAQTSQTQAEVTERKNKAYGRGNRLHAWIQTDQRPAAIDAHNQGMERLRSADAYLARIPKQATEDDWLAYGHTAMVDLGAAIEHFNRGLALYPAGKPPKKA